MAQVLIHIWHDVNGQIVGIGRPRTHAGARHQAVPLAGRNQAVLETMVEENLISYLHQTHMVDVERQVLIEVKQGE